MKYDEIKGFIRGISDEEFEIFLKLAFPLNGFAIEKIRRNVLSANDYLLTLARNEKRGFFQRQQKINYISYVDRKQQEYSTEWITNFMSRANAYDTYLLNFEKIFVMNMNKIQNIDLPKNLKRKFQFITEKKFFDFFNAHSENIAFLEPLYPKENQMWDNKKPEQQKEFCEKIGVDFIKYARLWKYPIGQQSKLIVALQNDAGRKQSEKHYEKEENHYDSDSSNLKKYYDILEIDENASPTEIKDAFRKWIKFYHPDKYENRPPEDIERAKKKAEKINVAYEELKNAGKVD